MSAMSNRHNSSGERAFSLIEVLIAIAVMMVVITSPLTLIYESMSYQRLSEDETIAVYLAQDALEYVRARRAYNKKQGSSWNAGISCGSTCRVDTTVAQSSFALTPCSGAGCTLNYAASGNKLYSHTGGTATRYQRYLQITNHGANLEVTATVEWMDRTTPKSVSLKAHLYEL